MQTPPQAVKTVFPLLLCIVLLLLSACGTRSSRTSATTYRPTTVKDCDERQTTYTQVPQRVVAMDGMSAELLLALGIQNRIVAMGYPNPDEQVDPKVLQDVKKIPVVWKAYPNKEELVAQRPDLVISMLPSAFEDAYHNYSRDELQKLHINSFLGHGNCLAVQDTSKFDPTYTDLQALGEIFSVEARAQQLIEAMSQKVASVQKQVQGRTPLRVMSYGGGQNPFAVGGHGIANTVITLAGGKNVFADVPKNIGTVSWESIVERDPEVIWLIPNADGAGSCCTVPDMEQFLLRYPPIANVSAIKHRRFVVVYQNAGEFESANNADAVKKMAQGLFPGIIK